MATAQPAPWQVLYSRELKPVVGEILPQHRQLFTPHALKTLPGACLAKRVNVLLARKGKFVAPGRMDTLYLFTLTCAGGGVDHTLRYAVIRDNRSLFAGVMVEHKGLSVPVEAYVLNDIDRDGLQEVVTVLGEGENGYLVEWLTIWTPATSPGSNALVASRHFIVTKYQCEADDPAWSGVVRHWTLYVRPGPQPTFSADLRRKTTCRDGAPFPQVTRKGPAPEMHTANPWVWP